MANLNKLSQIEQLQVLIDERTETCMKIETSIQQWVVAQAPNSEESILHGLIDQLVYEKQMIRSHAVAIAALQKPVRHKPLFEGGQDEHEQSVSNHLSRLRETIDMMEHLNEIEHKRVSTKAQMGAVFHLIRILRESLSNDLYSLVSELSHPSQDEIPF